MLLLNIITFLCFYHWCHGDYFELLLLRDLFNGYNAYERPVAVHSDPVVVQLDFELEQVVDLVRQLLSNIL